MRRDERRRLAGDDRRCEIRLRGNQVQRVGVEHERHVVANGARIIASAALSVPRPGPHTNALAPAPTTRSAVRNISSGCVTSIGGGSSATKPIEDFAGAGVQRRAAGEKRRADHSRSAADDAERAVRSLVHVSCAPPQDVGHRRGERRASRGDVRSPVRLGVDIEFVNRDGAARSRRGRSRRPGLYAMNVAVAPRGLRCRARRRCPRRGRSERRARESAAPDCIGMFDDRRVVGRKQRARPMPKSPSTISVPRQSAGMSATGRAARVQDRPGAPPPHRAAAATGRRERRRSSRRTIAEASARLRTRRRRCSRVPRARGPRRRARRPSFARPRRRRAPPATSAADPAPRPRWTAARYFDRPARARAEGPCRNYRLPPGVPNGQTRGVAATLAGRSPLRPGNNAGRMAADMPHHPSARPQWPRSGRSTGEVE